jgi:hypothetical protein
MGSTWIFTGRPSAPTSACAPNALAPSAQAHVLGREAVQIQVRTAPFAALAGESATVKINNYIDTAMSNLPTPASAWAQKVQDDKVKGGDARGIPPRGTPV